MDKIKKALLIFFLKIDRNNWELTGCDGCSYSKAYEDNNQYVHCEHGDGRHSHVPR